MSLPPAPPPNYSTQFGEMIVALRQNAAATLAASIIHKANRPHSVKEAAQVYGDVLRAISPKGGVVVPEDTKKRMEDPHV